MVAVREHIVFLAGIHRDHMRASLQRGRKVRRWNRKLSSQRVTRHLQATLVPYLRWGSQLWTPSRNLFDFVKSAERRRLRRMNFDPRASGDDWISYHPRRRARALHARPQGGGQTAWRSLCGTVHGWWRRVQRHLGSPANAFSHCRGPRKWGIVQALQSADAERERPRRNWHRLPEYAVEQFGGGAAHKQALDRTVWARKRRAFVAWCMTRFGPQPLRRRATV